MHNILTYVISWPMLTCFVGFGWNRNTFDDIPMPQGSWAKTHRPHSDFVCNSLRALTSPQPEVPQSLRGSNLPGRPLESMASIPEIYPKLREALEKFLHDHTEVTSRLAESQARQDASRRAVSFREKFLKVAEMELTEVDIVSMEDLAVACAKPLFWNDSCWVYPDMWYGCPRPYENSSVKQVAEDLLCLLKPVGEQLLPPDGPADLRIWETFAAAKMQHRQFCIAAVYPKKIALRGKDMKTGLQKNNFLVLAMKRKFKGLVNAFEKVHLSIETHVSPELRSSLTNFTARLSSCCEGTIRRMTWENFPQANLEVEMSEMTERWVSYVSPSFSDCPAGGATSSGWSCPWDQFPQLFSQLMEYGFRDSKRSWDWLGGLGGGETFGGWKRGISWQPVLLRVRAWGAPLLFAFASLQGLPNRWGSRSLPSVGKGTGLTSNCERNMFTIRWRLQLNMLEVDGYEWYLWPKKIFEDHNFFFAGFQVCLIKGSFVEKLRVADGFQSSEIIVSSWHLQVGQCRDHCVQLACASVNIA